MDEREESSWHAPHAVTKIHKFRGKKRAHVDEGELIKDQELSIPDKKKKPVDRKRSIFTLSNNNNQIAEEQFKIKNIFTTLSDKTKHDEDEAENDSKKQWHEELCLDWSLKSSLKISSKNNFAWSSNNLKSSEESSGISAFVRCIDIEPLTKGKQFQVNSPKLDTSLGAQFHQCCLYWQHPYLPSMSLFPREAANNTTFTAALNSSNSPTSSCSIKLDQNVLDCLHLEWVDALRSSFQLLRLRQSPFFYVCSHIFTCLFCAAGTRDQQIQIFVTPSTKGLRDSLKKEGIKFDMPNFQEDMDNSQSQSSSSSSQDKIGFFPQDKPSLKTNCNESVKTDNHHDNSDEEPDQWLDDMGISQDIPISNHRTSQSENSSSQKLKSTLVVVSGTDALPFFNFLINSKNILTASSGPMAGIPPTILGPVAFHGASLRSVKVRQKKVKSEKGDYYHSIEMVGPILPHVMHMLSTLLSKTVSEYKIRASTLFTTIPLNNLHLLNSDPSEEPNFTHDIPSAFELQNLSDCGLGKSTLEVFCKRTNCSTVKEILYRKDGLFHWS